MKAKRWLRSLHELLELLICINKELRDAIVNWREFQELSEGDSGNMTAEEENAALAQMEQAKNNLENIGKE